MQYAFKYARFASNHGNVYSIRHVYPFVRPNVIYLWPIVLIYLSKKCSLELFQRMITDVLYQLLHVAALCNSSKVLTFN